MALKVAIASTSRADYSHLQPLIQVLRGDSRFEVVVVATRFRRVEFDEVSEPAIRIATSTIGNVFDVFLDQLRRVQPDIGVVLGDRSEMLAASIAFVQLGIPLAHLHGGELTKGSLDDRWRAAISQIADLHLVAAASFADRLRELGIRQNVHIVGAPGLDGLASVRPEEGWAHPVVLVSYHPTPNLEVTKRELAAILKALPAARVGTILFTGPSADPGGDWVRARVEQYVAGVAHARFVESLGGQRYRAAMASADLLIGNSSSGIIEAPSFRLPVVNVGARQDGRPRTANVIDVSGDPSAITAAIERALDPGFREQLLGLTNPYGGDGHACERICEILASWGTATSASR